MPNCDVAQPTERRASVNEPNLAMVLVRSVVVTLVLCAALAFAPRDASAKYASLVVDAESGEVLHAVNADTRNYPASLTKMMTLYLVFERLDRRIWSYDTLLKVSRRAAGQPPSRLGLAPGSTIKVKDAILALVTKSANDVATVVAENVSGSERNFALKMTATARRLGMKSTTFRNASGLPHRGQLSTARDMAVLAQAHLRDFPQYYHFFSVEEFRYGKRSYGNHNALLGEYDGVDGIKTGYIRASGFNLVASAVRDGRRLIAVVFGGKSSRSRNAHMVSLLNEGFAKIDAPRIDVARVPRRPSRTGADLAEVAEVAETDEIAQGSAEPRTSKPEVKMASAVDAIATVSAGTDAGPRREFDPRYRWGIQVGAFSRYSQALAAAKTSAKKLPVLMEHGYIEVVPLKQRSGKVLHRARIYGFSKGQAYLACKKFRDCLEIRLEDPMEVASTTR